MRGEQRQKLDLRSRLGNASGRSDGRGIAAILVFALALACSERPIERSVSGETAAARVVVDEPTVVAYFVIPAGAVDTMPDLAVEADDWNVAMSSLGDSLQANGVAFAIVTDPTLTLAIRGRSDTTLKLGAFRSSGYVYARPGEPACQRPGAAEPDSVVAVARSGCR